MQPVIMRKTKKFKETCCFPADEARQFPCEAPSLVLRVLGPDAVPSPASFRLRVFRRVVFTPDLFPAIWGRSCAHTGPTRNCFSSGYFEQVVCASDESGF
jgi:hypothetical protein